jgi:hypothetical protein
LQKCEFFACAFHKRASEDTNTNGKRRQDSQVDDLEDVDVLDKGVFWGISHSSTYAIIGGGWLLLFVDNWDVSIINPFMELPGTFTR